MESNFGAYKPFACHFDLIHPVVTSLQCGLSSALSKPKMKERGVIKDFELGTR